MPPGDQPASPAEPVLDGAAPDSFDSPESPVIDNTTEPFEPADSAERQPAIDDPEGVEGTDAPATTLSAQGGDVTVETIGNLDFERIGENAKQLGSEIVAALRDQVANLKLTGEELAIAQRASERLASATILSIGAPVGVQEQQREVVDSAVATLANLYAGEAAEGRALIRSTVQSVIQRAVKFAFGLLAAAL